MSAFICGPEHIGAMVAVALEGPSDGPNRHTWNHYGGLAWYHQDTRYELDRNPTPEDIATVGRMLFLENVRSVNYRYEDNYRYQEEDAREYAPPPKPTLRPTRVEAFKIIACYEYQACETPDWEQSQAHAFCRALEKRLIHSLPGYEDANGWDWRNPTSATEVRP
jgi:hypothetical protein